LDLSFAFLAALSRADLRADCNDISTFSLSYKQDTHRSCKWWRHSRLHPFRHL
jgi:hypothetical protein